MNKSVLIKMIDRLVENRVNKILNSRYITTKIDEIVSKRLLNLITEGSTITKNDVATKTNNIVKKNTDTKKNKKYSENSIINDILNETAAENEIQIPPETNEHVGNAFSSIIDNEFGSINKKQNINEEVVIVDENTGKKLPNHLANAFTKNYSSKLKDMDSRAQKYRSGGGNISNFVNS